MSVVFQPSTVVVRLVRAFEHAKTNSCVYFLEFHGDSAKYSACLRSQQGEPWWPAARPATLAVCSRCDPGVYCYVRRVVGCLTCTAPPAGRRAQRSSAPLAAVFSSAPFTDCRHAWRWNLSSFPHCEGVARSFINFTRPTSVAALSASVAWADERPATSEN